MLIVIAILYGMKINIATSFVEPNAGNITMSTGWEFSWHLFLINSCSIRHAARRQCFVYHVLFVAIASYHLRMGNWVFYSDDIVLTAHQTIDWYCALKWSQFVGKRGRKVNTTEAATFSSILHGRKKCAVVQWLVTLLSVLHASGTGQLLAYPPASGLGQFHGKPTRMSVGIMGSNYLVVGEDHLLGPSCQRYNWQTGSWGTIDFGSSTRSGKLWQQASEFCWCIPIWNRHQEII